MKKTITFIALFTIIAATSNAQSASEMRSTVANVAPSVPALEQYSGSGQAWHSGKSSYSMESRDKIQAWIKANPKEATDFKAWVTRYIMTTDAGKLSQEELGVYNELKAVWSMVSQSPELNRVSRPSPAATK